MDAVASQHASNTDRQPRTTRELVAGATLVAFGTLGVFLPFLSGALFVSMVGAGATGLEAIVLAGQIATSIPLVCIVALVAAIGLYRHASWSRATALTVGALLAASPAAHVVGSGASDSGVGSIVHMGTTEDSPVPPVVAAVLHHVFAAQASAPIYVSLVVAAIGAVVLAALWRGARPIGAPAPGPAAPVRRPSTAMLLLLVTGILSIGPYVSWLLAAAIPRTAVASGGSAIDSGTGGAVAIGLLYAIPGAMGSISALAAARAIHARAAYGPWIAPAASLTSGGWSALWIAFVAAMTSTGGGAATAVGLFLFGVALVCAASFFVVTASVFRRRTWFTGSAVVTSPRRRRPGRFWTVTGGAGGALAIPLALSLATSIGRPELPHVDYGAVLFGGVEYHYAGPVDVPEDRLSDVGDLEAWDASLGIDDPTVYAIDSVPASEAIALPEHRELGKVTLTVYVPLLTSVDQYGAFLVPNALCQYVDLEAPGVSVQPCGPPGVLSLRGIEYVDTGEDYVVAVADLAATSDVAVAATAPDVRVDLTVHGIRDVPIDEAFALRVGSRVVVYQAGIYPAELCRYSPAAISDPLQTKVKEIDETGEIPGILEWAQLVVPFGCEFPPAVRFGGRVYQTEFRTVELLDVPLSAVTPIGVGLATEPGEPADGTSEHPFPPTLDDTVYSIAGVDPSVAVAFAVLDRYIVLRSTSAGLPVPPELCPYVRIDILQRYIAEGETDLGCHEG